MSSTDEDARTEREPKKYCCGNSSQNEAGYVSRCDVVIALVDVMIWVFVTVFTFLNLNLLLSFLGRYNNFKQFKRIWDFSLEYQITIFGVAILWELFHVYLAILLLQASSQRSRPLLRKWFTLTIIVSIIGIFCTSFVIYHMTERLYFIIFFVFYYLYKWYALWIVTELLKEIKEQNPYALPSDF